MTRWLSKSLALFLAALIASCGWKVTPPPRPEGTAPPRRIADRVVLQMNEGGVVWGGGRMGELTRNALIASGAFGEVYYPIEPRMPPALRLAIDAHGTVDEEVGFGVVKSVIIGALLFLPVGIIRFSKDFTLDAQVVLLNGGQEVRRFQVTSAIGIAHTMFSDTDSYEAAGREAAATYLAAAITAQLQGSGTTL